MVMVWLPGQGTPVHDHGGAWRVVCCLGGTLTITDFAAEEALGSPPSELRTFQLSSASEGTTCSPEQGIHQVTNCADSTAYSLHIYEREITSYRVYDPDAGRWEQRQMATTS